LGKLTKTGLSSYRKTKGGTRYYAVADLLAEESSDKPTVCYARVSSYDQKQYLERQQAMLEAYCAAKGWRTETIKDLGSGKYGVPRNSVPGIRAPQYLQGVRKNLIVE